jgi:hypothetical protein
MEGYALKEFGGRNSLKKFGSTPIISYYGHARGRSAFGGKGVKLWEIQAM